jgi:ABC-type uncharacterized transport system permease subunit
MRPLDLWFLIGVALFVISALVHLVALWRPSGRSPRLANRALEVGLVFWPLLLVCWWYHHGGEGLNRLLLGASAWSVGALYRASLLRYPLAPLGSVASGTAAALGALAFMFTRPISLDPSLSRWALYGHIALALAGLTAFSVSAGASGLYLWVERRLKSKTSRLRPAQGSRLPSLSTLDALCLKGLLVGFPLYTLALLIGSAQAFQGHGGLHLSYLVSAAAWLVYGGVLQARLTAGWRGRRAAWLTIWAFIALMLVVAQYSVRG